MNVCIHFIAHISASVAARLLYDQFWRPRPCLRPMLHHVLLYLTLTLYVYINATLVRHDLNTRERLPEVITETIPLAHHEVLSIVDSHCVEPRTSPRRF